MDDDSKNQQQFAPVNNPGQTLSARSADPRPEGRLKVGDQFPLRRLNALQTVSGTSAWPSDLPAGGLVHLQLRRFAGCPICNLHLRSVTRRIAEINAAGVQEIVAFHSTREELVQYQTELPSAVVADPDRALYKAVGVEPSLRALADPRFWLRFPRVLAQAVRELAHGGIPMRPTNGQLGRPADFLLDSTGRVVAVHYGAHAADQWSVDELIALAARP